MLGLTRRRIIGAFFSTLLLADSVTATSSPRKRPPGGVNIFGMFSPTELHMKGLPVQSVKQTLPPQEQQEEVQREHQEQQGSWRPKVQFTPHQRMDPMTTDTDYRGDQKVTGPKDVSSEYTMQQTHRPVQLYSPMKKQTTILMPSLEHQQQLRQQQQQQQVQQQQFTPSQLLQHERATDQLSDPQRQWTPPTRVSPSLGDTHQMQTQMPQVTVQGSTDVPGRKTRQMDPAQWQTLMEQIKRDSSPLPEGLHTELGPYKLPTYKPISVVIAKRLQSSTTTVQTSRTLRNLLMGSAALGTIGGGIALGLIQSGLVQTLPPVDVVYGVLANYWSTTIVAGASEALAGLMAAVKTPIVANALAWAPSPGGAAVMAISLLAYYHRQKIIGAMKTAWEAAKGLVRYVFGSKPDSTKDMAQVIVLARLRAQSKNQSIVPDNLREVLPNYFDRLSVKRYMQWVEQAVATNNGINQYMLARYALSLIKNPFDKQEHKNRMYPGVPLANNAIFLSMIIDGGPFTLGTALHCIYHFTEAYVDPDIYKRFLKESGMSALSVYLMGVQTAVNKQGVERAVRFMQIHMEFGLGREGLANHLDRNVEAKDSLFFELMYWLNLERLVGGTSLVYADSIQDAIMEYLQDTVAPQNGMPREHQRALDHFLGSLRCFSRERPHQALCDYLRQNINQLTGGRRIDMEATDNWHLALLQDFEYQKDQLRAARGNATFMAYSLQEMAVEPDAVWGVGLEKFSTKMIAAYWKAIQGENEKLKTLVAQAKQTVPEGQSVASAYPVTPCMAGKETRVYIPLETLPSAEDFDSLTNEARLHVVLGVLYLMTGIHMDDLGEYQFLYELSLPNQLSLLIEQFCEAQPGEHRQKSRVNFV